MSKGRFRRAAKRVVFIGSKPLGLSCLQLIHSLTPDTVIGVITTDDRQDNRNCFVALTSFCVTAGIPCVVSGSKAETAQAIADWAPDMCFVSGWYQLFDKSTLDATPAGFIGIHPSRLPAYRGGAPLVWTMILGEPEAWASFFYMTEGMDDGDIVEQISVPIEANDYIADVLVRLERAILKALPKIWRNLSDGTIASRPQPENGISYCAQRMPDDGRVDWCRPAREVFDFIRAQTPPYPGAFFVLNEERIAVLKAHVFPAPYAGTPGQVARVSADGVIVICGDNRAIVLTELLHHGHVVPASAVLKTFRLRL